jgi:hypothetical protein
LMPSDRSGRGFSTATRVRVLSCDQPVGVPFSEFWFPVARRIKKSFKINAFSDPKRKRGLFRSRTVFPVYLSNGKSVAWE